MGDLIDVDKILGQLDSIQKESISPPIDTDKILKQLDDISAGEAAAGTAIDTDKILEQLDAVSDIGDLSLVESKELDEDLSFGTRLLQSLRDTYRDQVGKAKANIWKPFKQAFWAMGVMARPTAAYYGGVFMEPQRDWLKTLKGLGLEAQENEILTFGKFTKEEIDQGKHLKYARIVYKQKPERKKDIPKVLGFFAPQALAPQTVKAVTGLQATRTVDVPLEKLGVHLDFKKTIERQKEELLTGLEKGIMGEEYYSWPGQVKEINDVYDPSVSGAAEVAQQTLAFGIDIGADPMNAVFDAIAPARWLSKSKIVQKMFRALDDVPAVRQIKAAFNLWTGNAKKIHNKSLEARALGAESLSDYAVRLEKYVGDYDSFLDMVVNERGFSPQRAEVFKRTFGENFLKVSRATEKNKMRLDKAIRIFHRDIDSKHFREIKGLYKTLQKYYGELSGVKRYVGLPEKTFKEKPYFTPFREAQEGVSRAPIESPRLGIPKTSFKRKIETFGDFIDTLNTLGRRVDTDIPMVVLKDTAETIHAGVMKSFYDDLAKLGKWKSIPDDLADDFERLVMGRKTLDINVDNLIRWKNKNIRPDMTKLFEDISGVRITEANRRKITSFLKDNQVFRPLKNIGQMPPEYKKTAEGVLGGIYLVDKEVGNYFKSVSNMLFSPDQINSFATLMRKVNLPFKLGAVPLNSYFYFKYYFTNFFQNWKGGWNPMTAGYTMPRALSVKLIGESGGDGMVWLGGKSYKAKDLWDVSLRMGVPKKVKELMGDEATWQVVRMMKNMRSSVFKRRLSSIRPQKWLGHGDDVFRLNLFMDYLEKHADDLPDTLDDVLRYPWEKGYDAGKYKVFSEAAAHVGKHMYTYMLSPFAKNYIRPIFPFAAWMIENTPEMIRFLGHWDKLHQIARGRAILEDVFPTEPDVRKVMPKWLKERRPLQINVPTGSDDIKVFVDVPIPMKDLLDFDISADSLSGLFARTGPAGVLIGAMQGISYYKNRETKGRYAPAPIWSAGLMKIPGMQKMFPKLFNVGYNLEDPSNPEVVVMMEERAQDILEGYLPFLRQITKRAGNYGYLKALVDFDDLYGPDYSTQLSIKQESNFTDIYADVSAPDVGKLPLAPTGETDPKRKITRQLKNRWGAFNFSAINHQEQLQRRMGELEKMLRENTDIDWYGDVVVPPLVGDYHKMILEYMKDTGF